MSSYIFLLISICLGIAGQVFFKMGALKTETFGIFNLSTVTAFSLYSVAAVFYLFSLKRIPLSVAFPSVSISYVIIAVISHYMWKEPFGLNKILALLLIMAGITLLHWPKT
ncbi:MAG: SMR family transporter [bacterium]|nr:SMR family transporter [bacterium]